MNATKSTALDVTIVAVRRRKVFLLIHVSFAKQIND